MTKITEVEDRGATVAWSPVSSHADYLALGVKDSGSIGFDDYGGELELYDLNMSDPSGAKPKLMGSTKTTTRFASVGWTTPLGRYGTGLIAGGMVDGVVNIWNPSAMMDNQQQPQQGPSPLVASIKRHEGGGPVKALQFNTMLAPEMLATGGGDGQMLITSLENPDVPVTTLPGSEPSPGAEITGVSWNTQVAHIVASSASDGLVSVWDLKGQKPWCQFRADGMAVASMAWNPSQGLHLVTASIDDRNPILKLWDLRASTSMPLATLSGHSQGILGLSWCPHDDTLLLSCGKDNRTILWDLHTLQPIADIPNDDVGADPSADPAGQTSASSVYGAGGMTTSQQKRYDVQWSPIKRGVVSTCSFDRKVQAHSVIGLATKCGRPPKWMKPSSGVSCGFAGSVVSFSASDKVVKMSTVVEEPTLVNTSQRFEHELGSTDVVGFCRSMMSASKTPTERQIWSFMQVIFESNARAELLEHLGFHPEEISRAATEFSEDASAAMASMSLEEKSKGAGMTPEAEKAVQQALLVGNFEAAVECCFRTGNLADGLILASCGGAELWAKTQQRYFEGEARKRPFLSIVGAILHSQLDGLVASSDTKKWEETLAILSTYGKSEEFPALCIALGDRLEAAGDYRNASLCFMCSLSLDRAVKFWKSQLTAANKARGSIDLIALHDFVVKVEVFLKALEPSHRLDPEVSDIFFQYAKSLADQGLLVTASKYCRGDSIESKILRDRLYRSRESPNCLAALGAAPEFPFSMTNVNKAPKQATASSQQYNQGQRQQHAYGHQQQAARTQATSYNTSQQRQAATTAQQHTQQPTQAAASSQTAPAAEQLPSGWIALSDPSSGRTYYANQTSGETTWEKPEAPKAAPAPAPTPVPAPTATPAYQGQSNGHMHQPTASSATPSRLASKYGDGFVTSASHPELAEQYGNVGTSNPYTGAARPGTAVVQPAAKAPVSGTFDPNAIAELSTENQAIKDCLLALASALSGAYLTPIDKKQLSEGEKGIAVLLKRLARRDIDPEVEAKVASMVTALSNQDYMTAASIQTGLVNSDWRDNKDWLKGIKFLIQLATKKLAN